MPCPSDNKAAAVHHLMVWNGWTLQKYDIISSLSKTGQFVTILADIVANMLQSHTLIMPSVDRKYYYIGNMGHMLKRW